MLFYHEKLFRKILTLKREKIFATIQEGSQISGVIKNLTDYGAFVDLGGIDGLLHITDITWKKNKSSF